MISINISCGEYFDKLSILYIKKEKIIDESKLILINYEINELEKLNIFSKLDNSIFEKLKNIYIELWNIEDNIREKEKKKEFDTEFIDLARKVYITNDKRADIKLQINKLLNSSIIEVKSYSDYK